MINFEVRDQASDRPVSTRKIGVLVVENKSDSSDSVNSDEGFRDVESADFIILGGERDKGPVINQVEGILNEKTQMNMRGTLVGRYSLTREDDTAFTVLGAKLLDEKMVNVEVGDFVRITLEEGKQKTSGGNEMKLFRVQVKE